MAILTRGKKSLPDGERESLHVHIDFNEWIFDLDRIDIETSLENWFRAWQLSVMKSSSDFHDKDSFERARAELITSMDYESIFKSDDYNLNIQPSFILNKIDGGSLRKELFVGLVVGGLFSSISTTTSLYPNESRQVISSVIVDTRKTFSEFINHVQHVPWPSYTGYLSVIEEDVSLYAWKLFSKVEKQKNISIELTSFFHGEVQSTFRIDNVTAQAAMRLIVSEKLR